MPEGTCPKCGSADVVEIVIGYPTDEANAAAERDEVMVGGGMSSFGAPDPVWGWTAYHHGSQPIDPAYDREPTPPASPSR